MEPICVGGSTTLRHLQFSFIALEIVGPASASGAMAYLFLWIFFKLIFCINTFLIALIQVETYSNRAETKKNSNEIGARDCQRFAEIAGVFSLIDYYLPFGFDSFLFSIRAPDVAQFQFKVHCCRALFAGGSHLVRKNVYHWNGAHTTAVIGGIPVCTAKVFEIAERACHRRHVSIKTATEY